jgi:hypothetical protein
MATVLCATTTALRLEVRTVPLRRITRRGELALVLVLCCSTRCKKLRATSTTTPACGCGREGVGPARR